MKITWVVPLLTVPCLGCRPAVPYAHNPCPAELTMPNFSQSPGGFASGMFGSNVKMRLVVIEEYGDGSVSTSSRWHTSLYGHVTDPNLFVSLLGWAASSDWPPRRLSITLQHPLDRKLGDRVDHGLFTATGQSGQCRRM